MTFLFLIIIFRLINPRYQGSINYQFIINCNQRFYQYRLIINSNTLMKPGEHPSLLQSLKGHKQSIIALDLHPKCRYVASAGLDSSFFIWDVRDKLNPRKYQGHKGNIQDLKFHPNGLLVASCSADGAIKFWEVENQNKQVTITKAHNSKVRSIDYSCDGNLIVSGGDDKVVKVWSTIDRRLQGQYKKHDNWVRSVEFSPIAKSIISCDERFVYIWDVATKKVIQQFKQHAGVIHQVKFHSLGNIAASCSFDRKIKLYDLRANQVIQVYDGHQGGVKTFDFHPHTCHIISSSEEGVTRIWNTQRNRLQYKIQSPSNVSKFSREGDYFITAGVQKTINLWKTGFYDSFKQKIIGNPVLSEEYKDKVKYQVKELKEKNISEGSQNIGMGKDKAGTGGRIQERNEQEMDPDIVYCHDKQNFQILNIERKQRKQGGKFSVVIPTSLQKKLQKMSTQLDFITRTTQILQARVLNNGEQLRRIVEMVQMSGRAQDS